MSDDAEIVRAALDLLYVNASATEAGEALDRLLAVVEQAEKVAPLIRANAPSDEHICPDEFEPLLEALAALNGGTT